MPRKTDKRIRLIEAAKTLIHQQGFNLTTLADIAQEANVPLGNVYYYFKTKEAIGFAVIERQVAEWSQRLATWSEITDPLARLMALIQYNLEQLELITRFGCPIGGLCQELGKQGGPLSDLAAKVLHDILEWCEEQFKALGLENAPDLALNLIANIQGVYLLIHASKELKFAQQQHEELMRWLEGLTNRKISMPRVNFNSSAMLAEYVD